jgi:hypothetical protein
VEANCLACQAVVTFDGQPGYTTWKGCRAKLYACASSEYSHHLDRFVNA